VDRHLKKVAKTDEFKEGFWGSWDFLSHHTEEIKKYGAIALAVILLGGGIWFYVRHQATVRQEALSAAFKVDEAAVGATPASNGLHFDTEDQKGQALQKSMGDIAAKYHGSQEGAIAAMYLAQLASDKGDLKSAEKFYKDAAEGPAIYASQANLALAQVYAATGRDADSKKLLNDLMNHPTLTVSKEEATIELAKVTAKTDKDAAIKLLDPLKLSPRATVSKVALSTMAEISGNR
jgi:hypothetical protein